MARAATSAAGACASAAWTRARHAPAARTASRSATSSQPAVTSGSTHTDSGPAGPGTTTRTRPPSEASGAATGTPCSASRPTSCVEAASRSKRSGAHESLTTTPREPLAAHTTAFRSLMTARVTPPAGSPQVVASAAVVQRPSSSRSPNPKRSPSAAAGSVGSHSIDNPVGSTLRG